MFNMFKSKKKQTQKQPTQQKGAITKSASNEDSVKTKQLPVHGTNDVCCGSCGGE